MSLKSILTFRSAPAVASAAEAPKPLASLLHRYQAMRQQTAALTAPLTAEDQMVQSCAEASPTKWHLAHTSWFFETFILSQHLKDYRPFHPQFRSLFNSYYNAVGAQPEKAIRNTFSRPSLEDVQMYRRYVDDHMHKLLDSADLPEEAGKLAELGINHEQQHQELLVTDIKNAFWVNPLRPQYQQSVASPSVTEPPAQKPHAYGEGLYEIGSPEDSFHFDNEGPRHKVYVQPFRFAMRLVTNGEYIAFMEDQGYSRPELWLSDGWLAVQKHGWNAPLYWEKNGHDWQQFTCSGMRNVEEHEPVCHVSYYEADAFARWAGARLASEAEWEVAASQAKVEGNLLEQADSILLRQARSRLTGRSSFLAMCGSGRPADICRIRDTSPPRERWANTTANSCVTRWCCGEARALRPAHTSGPAIEISLLRKRAGSFQE